MVKFFRNRNKTDVTYVLKFDVTTVDKTIVVTILNNKQQWKQFIYRFDQEFPSFQYNLFFENRVLLHCFMTVCCNNVPHLENCSKLIIQSNKSYLKHLKDWFPSWKKNKFCIEHVPSQSLPDDENPSFFDFGKMCSFYFSFEPSNKESTMSDTVDQTYFDCVSLSDQKKSMFERLSERPNTDLIVQCFNLFDDSKLIRFV